MALLAFCGHETGDGLELSAALQTTYSVQPSVKRTGGYALKTDNASYSEQPIFSGLAATTLYLSFKHYFENLSTPGSDKFGAVIVLRTAGGAAIVSIQQFHTSGGGYALTVRNEVSGTNHGTNYFISGGQWYTLQLYVAVSATVGVVELKIDSLTTLTLLAQNTGATAINDVRAANVSSSPGSGFHNQYFDDWAISSTTYPGDQRVIARQGKAGTPTYNAWTKSSGTAANALWSDTPFSAATECHSTAQNQAQTMLLADAGAGTDAIGASDAINGCRVVGVGKLRAGTNKRTYSVRRRIGGADTDESVTSQQSTTGDAIFQGSVFTTTLANLQSGEIGGLRGATTSNSQEWQIEDMWMMVAYTPAALSYSLTSDGGSFSIAGTAAALKAGRQVGAAAGSYSWTGVAASARMGRKLAADAGSYAWTEADAALLRKYTLRADAGSYAWVGVDATLTKTANDKTLSADAGAFDWTGIDAALSRTRSLDSGIGIFVWTGADAALQAVRLLGCTSGAYALTGVDAAFLAARFLSAQAGAYAWTGSAAQFAFSKALAAVPGAYSWSGQAAALRKGFASMVVPGSFVWTGVLADLLTGRRLDAGAWAFLWDGVDATLDRNASQTLTAAPGAFAWAGVAAQLLAGRKLDGGTGAFDWAGTDLDFARTRVLMAAPGAYLWTGAAATLSRSSAASFEAGELLWVGTDAGLRAARRASTAAGAYSLMGTTAQLMVARIFQLEPGSVEWNGAAAALNVMLTLGAGVGSFAWDGVPVDFVFAHRLAADTGAFDWAGQPAVMVWTGEVHSAIHVQGSYQDEIAVVGSYQPSVTVVGSRVADITVQGSIEA